MPDLCRRCRQPEVMDQPELANLDHRRALAGLARINWFSGSAALLWPAIANEARANGEKPLRVLDIATGAGDVPLRLWRRAMQANLNVEFSACDISSTALDYARRRALAAGAPIRFFRLNAVSEEIPGDFDVITSSLFLHHLPDDAAQDFLRRAGAAARRMLLVHDLLRSRRGYWLAWLATRFLTASWVARIDGPLSIRGAFTCDEVESMAGSAGLERAAITRHWPERFLLTWRKPV